MNPPREGTAVSPARSRSRPGSLHHHPSNAVERAHEADDPPPSSRPRCAAHGSGPYVGPGYRDGCIRGLLGGRCPASSIKIVAKSAVPSVAAAARVSSCGGPSFVSVELTGPGSYFLDAGATKGPFQAGPGFTFQRFTRRSYDLVLTDPAAEDRLVFYSAGRMRPIVR